MLYNSFFKRFFDFLLALLSIVLLLPVMFFLTILGFIVFKGNPFFVQLRPGKKGKDGKESIIKIIKFRSMTNEQDEFGMLKPDVMRVTNYGRFIRSKSLDELPQLFSILKGELSLVGPRPQLIKDLVFMDDKTRMRHSVKPGLTGLAQVNGRNAISWEEKFELDLKYIENISFKNDLLILINTFKKVFIRNNSSEEVDLAYDYGDWLLKENKISDEYYKSHIKEAEQIINSYRKQK